MVPGSSVSGLNVVRRKTAGQSHEAMFESGLTHGTGAAKEKCATKKKQ
jgi:hypothetical protein